MHSWFRAYVPLSNWLRGYDRYSATWSKKLIRESKWPDRMFLLKENEDDFAVGIDKTNRLISKLGIDGDRIVILRCILPSGQKNDKSLVESVARKNDVSGTGVGWVWDYPTLPVSSLGWHDEHLGFTETSMEEITSAAFSLSYKTGLSSWQECIPRSFSILPVAKACQGKCDFCFSKSSISDMRRNQEAWSFLLNDTKIFAAKAKIAGAERGVITGGGEPFLHGIDDMSELIKILADEFGRVTLITNGHALSNMPESDRERAMKLLSKAGLTCLAVSRHGLDDDHDERIMGIRVSGDAVAKSAKKDGITTRAVCVLQKNGVKTVDDVISYLKRSVNAGFDEVCFKELYVSSVSENAWSRSEENVFSEKNKVPLSIVLQAANILGLERTLELPWGSPVFSGKLDGSGIKVAAYTEPSPGWERTHKLVRSWNLLADGQCFASLEDKSSLISKD